MKIFVTGATGVVGRRLVPLLGRAGHDVTGVARSAAGRTRLERDGASVVALDLFDSQAATRAVAGHDAVINLATHIPRSSGQMILPWAWRENDRLRRVASRTLVEASVAAGVSRFIQESFAPVYPDRGSAWIDETTPIEPVRYNRTVADAEAAAVRFSQSGGTGIVLRFAAFYGPDAVQTIEFIKWVKKGWGPLPGPASAYISSVSHDDAAAAAAAAIVLPAGTYNVSDDNPLTHREFIDSLARALGVAAPKLPPRWLTMLMGSLGEMISRSLRISNRKLRTSSSWVPEHASVSQAWPDVLARIDAGHPTTPSPDGGRSRWSGRSPSTGAETVIVEGDRTSARHVP